MEAQFGFKDLEQVLIKTNSPLEINGKNFEIGETIAAFDKITIGGFAENRTFVAAKGGFDNRAHVWWENTNELKFVLNQGIFSRTQFAVLTNSKIIQHPANEELTLNCQETVESDENGHVTFAHTPCSPIFIYNVSTGAKITTYTVISEKVIDIGLTYTDVLLDYAWKYTNGSSELVVGNHLTEGTFVLTGKTKVKDDITGQTKTGIITIPKLKLMSTLSIQLGSQATPIMGQLQAVAYPVGPRGSQRVMEITFLNDDIDSDM